MGRCNENHPVMQAWLDGRLTKGWIDISRVIEIEEMC